MIDLPVGRLLAMARDCEGLASHFVMLDQRRYADGVALAKIWYALNHIEHKDGTGLPGHVDADELADDIIRLINAARHIGELAGDPSQTT